MRSVLWLVLLAACARPLPDFNFNLGQTSGEAKQGETLELPLTITRLGGFNKKLSVAVDAPPSGISASPVIIQPEGKGVSLFVQIDKATPPGEVRLVIKVSGEGIANPKSKEYGLKVLAGFDFSLSLTPESLSLNQGSKARVKLEVNRAEGFSQAIEVSLSGLPSGVTAAPASIAPGSGVGSVDLELEATALAQPVKDQSLTISATGNGISKTASLKLSVIEPFRLEVADSISIGQGGSQEISIGVAREGFSGAIPLTFSGLPPKATLSPASLSIPEGQESVKAILRVEPTAEASSQTISVSGTALGLTKSKTLVLNIVAVAPDFDFTLAPSPLNLNQGGSAVLSVTAVRNPTLIGDIAVALLPAGVPGGVSTDPLTIPAGQTQGDLTFRATLDAEAASEREISLSATAQGITRTKTLKLNLLAVTGYGIAVNPTDLLIEKPATGAKTASIQINLTRTAYTDLVSLSLLGAPAGVSASFNPANLSGSVQSSTLTLSLDPSAIAQNDAYTLTVRASGTGGRQVDQTLGLRIADMAISAADLVAVRAETSALNFNLSRTGFSGEVQVTLAGLPAGVTAASPVAVSTSSGSFALTVAKDAVIPAGPVPLTLSATTAAVAGLSRTATINLSLKPQFEMLLHQGTIGGPVVSAVALQQGDNNFPGNLIWVEIKRNGSYSKRVYLRSQTDMAVLEVGQTAGSGQGFFPTEVAGNSSVFRFAAKPSAPVGNYSFFVEAVQLDSLGGPPVLDEAVKAKADLNLSLTSPFEVSLASSAGSINQGETSEIVINVLRNAPFSGPISVTATGLPTGITANPLTIGSASTSGVLTLVASNSAALGGPVSISLSGSATLGVQYTQTVLKTAAFSLSVNPKPAVDFDFNPTSLTLYPTAAPDSKSVILNLSRTNYSQAITVFIDPSTLPAGVVSDTNPKTIAATDNSVIVTLTASAGTAPVTGNVKFILSGSGIASVTKDLPVTVVGP